jgi:eukaryotic-like serine/threonine-protein kinase
MRKLDAETWRAASPYLDEVIELPESERPRWLAALGATKPELVTAVAQLLDDFRAVTDEGYLDQAPDQVPWPGLAGTTLGGYRLIAPIGDGGMGSVWLAARSDGRYEARVAVKLLNAGLLGHAVQQRFTREATILATLSHPNIAHLIDAGVSAIGQPYLVLEYVDGEPIDQYCQRRNLSADDRVRLFLDVLDAVAQAHAHLIVHRDLKPSNVFVSRDGQVKLLDFGIAKLLTTEAAGAATEITRGGGGAWTPAYAAPEQFTGGAVTTATDVYALGVLLYVLLAGQHPFADALDSPAALLQATTATEPPPLARHGDLGVVVHKALKKDPAERYVSVVALADDLRHYLEHEPISARPDALSYRAGMFVRRNRAVVAATAVAILALMAGLIGTVFQARRATAQAAIAAAERDFATRQLARAEAMNALNHFLVTEAVPADESFTVRQLLARAEEVVAQQHADDPETRADMLVTIGRQYWSQDQYEDARRVLQAAYGLSGSIAEPRTKARAACAYSSVLSKFAEEQRAEGLFQEGLAHVDAREDSLIRAFCYLCGSENAREFRHSALAIERAEVANRMLSASVVASPLDRLRAQLDLAESYRVASRNRDADRTFARAAAELTRLGYGETETAETLFNNWALVLWQLGRPGEAERLYQRAIAISSADGTDDRVSPFVLNNLARTLIDLARYDEALQYASRAYAKGVAAGNPVVTVQALFSRAAAHRERGDLAGADAAVREIAARGATMWGEGHPALVALAGERGELALARGDVETAAALATRVVETGERNDDHYVLPRALLRRAAVSLARQQPDAAREDAERALRIFQAAVGADGVSILVGRAAVLRARALAMLDRADEARAHLTVAIKHFDELAGTHPDRQHADRLLASIVGPGL